jgi:hypothetical protein
VIGIHSCKRGFCTSREIGLRVRIRLKRLDRGALLVPVRRVELIVLSCIAPGEEEKEEEKRRSRRRKQVVTDTRSPTVE